MSKSLLPLESVNLLITKATSNQKGPGRWACVASDTHADKATERTSLDLFADWIDRIETGKSETYLPPPQWPFLGLSHYPGLDGKGKGGITDKAYIDGNCFKAAGAFNANRLGLELSDAIITERALIRKGEFEGSPIRISAGWYDLSHKHVNHGHVFVRQSLIDKCPVCEAYGPEAQADKVYISGQLDHFACTRVPVNERTKIQPEHEVLKSMTEKKTRLEDAQSIVSPELAEEINTDSVAIGKSEAEDELPDAMVTRNDTDKADEQGGQNPDIEKAQSDKTKTRPPVKPKGANNHDKEDEEELTGEELEEMKAKKNKVKDKNKHDVMKAETDEAESPDTEKMGEAAQYPGPFGGATSMADAMKFIQAQEKLNKVYSRLEVFRTVVSNIQRNPMMDANDKVKAMIAAVNELAGEISVVKAAVEDAFLIEDVNNSDDWAEDESDLEADIYKSLYQNSEADIAAQNGENTMSNAPEKTNEGGQEFGYDAKIEAIKSDTTLTADEKGKAYQALLEEQAQAFKADVETTEKNQGVTSAQFGELAQAVAEIAKSNVLMQQSMALAAQKSATGSQDVTVGNVPVQKSMAIEPPAPVQAKAETDPFRQWINQSVNQ